MSTRDAYRYINELDDETVQGLISRLEFRASDLKFSSMRDAYLARLTFHPDARVLDVGCGTGVIGRSLARSPNFRGRIIGVDQSPVLIEAALRLAAEEEVSDRLEFRLGDAQRIDAPDHSFDVVIAHTTISHVADPLEMLREMSRLVREDGQVAIFDGDYASWTFAYPDLDFATTMDQEFVAAIVNNPRVIRDLPRLLRKAGLRVADTMAWIYAEIGEGNFHRNAAESYGPLVARAGRLPVGKVEDWISEQRRASASGEFFASCNYYAYIAAPTASL